MDNNQLVKTNFNLIAYLYEIAIAEQRKAALTNAVKNLEDVICYRKQDKKRAEEDCQKKHKELEALHNTLLKANMALEEKETAPEDGANNTIVALLIVLLLWGIFICSNFVLGVLLGAPVAIPLIIHISNDANRKAHNKIEDEKRQADQMQRQMNQIHGMQAALVRTENEIYTINGRIKDYDSQIQSYMFEKSALMQTLSQTEKHLDELYGFNIIDPYYRNATAVCYFIHYLQCGMCEELTGVHGAYSLFEMHYRLDMIIDNLVKINQKLNELSNSIETKLGRISYDLKANYKAINEAIGTQTSLCKQLLSERDDVSHLLRDIKKFQEIDNDQSVRFQKYVKEKLGDKQSK